MFTRDMLIDFYRGRQGGRERNIYVREKHQSVSSHTCLTRDWTHNPGMCPDQELNQWPFALWTAAQATEPHRSGQRPTSFALGRYRSFCFRWLWSKLSILSSCIWDCDLVCLIFFLWIVLLSFTSFSGVCLLLQNRISPFMCSWPRFLHYFNPDLYLVPF